MADFRVIAGHRRSYEKPITGMPGDVVTHHKRDDDAPGWRWCKHRVTGRSGWVPEAYLEILGPQAILTRNYDAMELTVSAGETLAVLERVAGWSLCRLGDDTGWVPDEKLAPV